MCCSERELQNANFVARIEIEKERERDWENCRSERIYEFRAA